MQVCEAQERERNVRKYAARRKAAEAAAKAAKAVRDAKPSKRGDDEEREGEGLADVGWDEDAVLPEFSLAGALTYNVTILTVRLCNCCSSNRRLLNGVLAAESAVSS
jgi:hypothetical protein